MILDIPFLYVISTAEIVWLRKMGRCYMPWPTVSFPPTGRTHEDAEFLSNTAFLCPGTKLVLPEYELGGLQLIVNIIIYVNTTCLVCRRPEDGLMLGRNM